MALHRLARAVIGVPDIVATGAYYRDFGLDQLSNDPRGQRFGTRGGGE
ncbi:hypothetical protein AB0I53_28910 [Saccharopolyspora sp. NPDC050389]